MKESIVLSGKRFILALVFIACGFVGAGAFYVCATLYNDHVALQQVIVWVNQVNANAQKAQAAQGQPPQPMPVPPK